MKVYVIIILILSQLIQNTKSDHDLGDTKLRKKDSMEMVFVPSGTFLMGSSDKQLDKAMDDCKKMYQGARDCQRHLYSNQEQPQHEVYLDAFWIDKTEVTNAQFCKFLNVKGNQTTNGVKWFEPGAGHRKVIYGHIQEIDGVFAPNTGYENYPVIEASWYGAKAYCNWIGGRLPTEAEWEYSAKGKSNNIYPWGNEFNGNLVNYRDSTFNFDNLGKDTAFTDGHPQWGPVGSYPLGASWCGALDMAGNVHEWVSDWYADDYYSNSQKLNPKGPGNGTLKIGRGGSWYDPRWHVRCSYRKVLTPSSARMHWIGFRCVIPEDKMDK